METRYRRPDPRRAGLEQRRRQRMAGGLGHLQGVDVLESQNAAARAVLQFLEVLAQR
jgi:hypothetical protein